jgi:hypothetical protein
VDHAFLTQVAAASTSQLLIIDDNGLDCPGGLPTIQEALARYLRVPRSWSALTLISAASRSRGSAKNGLKLIASGQADAVVLQGD